MHSSPNPVINVAENSGVVDELFDLELEDLCRSWLFRNYKVKYYYMRFEYQKRGSKHVHMVLWLDDEPELGEYKGLMALGRLCIAG